MDRTFNRADTTVQNNGRGRIRVISHMTVRMQLVVDALTTLTYKWKDKPVFPFEIIQEAMKSDTTHSYTQADMRYALLRCVQKGLIRRTSWGVYALTLDPKVATTKVM